MSECSRIVPAKSFQKYSMVYGESYETMLYWCKTDPSERLLFTGHVLLKSKTNISKTLPMLVTAEGFIVHISSETLQKRRNEGMNTIMIVSLINKTFFVTNSSHEVISGDYVLGVWLRNRLRVKEIHNISEPVQLRFNNTNQNENGTCVYWHFDQNHNGYWSTEGCSTSVTNTEFVCSCNRLGFFAVLINPKIPEEIHIVHLNYISYVGSALSIGFTATAMIIFLCQRKKHSDHSMIIHAQLAGSLFLLHISFLCSAVFSDRSDQVCKALGLILHWSLLATFSWTAIEGFHLYMLLVLVFNIYIRRYMLKISLVAWGVPTVTVMIYGIIDKYTSVYSKYAIYEEKDKSTNASICWITTPTVISYIAMNSYPGLVMIFNMVMLVVVLVKMHQLRSQDVQIKDNKKRLWKDWVFLHGFCFVLGVPWSLVFFTRAPLNLPLLYRFTILNSFQGVFLFLCFLTVTCKARKEEFQPKGTINVHFQSNEEHVTTSVVNNMTKKK
ncbi:adhesion G-protein coupled receptor G1-like isoform X2 [Misgurnus anguillicaudatus]|uniref:adhesion G-protein coupled receptor G1-like isoform X2 n=1 Tax=Misgurnus anguillicaudatus TaxID=75329 RepID=UPI003CCF53A1